MFYRACEGDYDEIVKVWEDSVRATHSFVAPEDIILFRSLVRDGLPNMTVDFARDGEGRISGFVGVAGDKMEMLFAAPKFIGVGIGKSLFLHAVHEMGARKVDVNEDNEHAVSFYMRQGCKMTGRSPLDSTGKPYPVLHLECPT
jgi:putative acetyltransferase